MSRYLDPPDGWQAPVSRGYKMMCCDCGLVHRLDFRVRRRHVQFRMERDNRATGQARRWNDGVNRVDHSRIVSGIGQVARASFPRAPGKGRRWTS